MLNKLSPFFAIMFSAVLLRERANRWEWGAVALAFCGALLVAKPSFNIAGVPALIGVLGGLGAGTAYTFVRLLGPVSYTHLDVYKRQRHTLRRSARIPYVPPYPRRAP